MAYHIIEVYAWSCDECGIECIHAGDGLPEEWAVVDWKDSPDGRVEVHACGVCFEKRFD